MKDKHFGITPNKEKSLFLAKREVSVLVLDAVNLEGINYTLPEVQTIMDGITVGGHRIADQQVVINQKNAWDKLFNLVKTGNFTLNKETVCNIHALSGFDDALNWGEFRDNDVRIAGTDYLPPVADKLDSLFSNMVNEANKIEDIYDKAIYVFLDMARNQYFFDVNKRTGRFMMNGILLNEGYPIINVKAKDKLEFNTLMIEFYESNDTSKMNEFLRKSIDEKTIEFMNQNKSKVKTKSKDFSQER
ncbi:MAG: Fic family protein [Alphaproteobacteria bacterium]|jgi:Fic family protein|nr:Fic family protein [Alphaproteobacteria bacterium]